MEMGEEGDYIYIVVVVDRFYTELFSVHCVLVAGV